MSLAVSVLLFTLLFVTGNADNKHLEKNENHPHEEVSLEKKTERHRYKRNLKPGVEDDYFKKYFEDMGLLQNYTNAKHPNGTITNWIPLNATSYTNAIRRSTQHYAIRAGKGDNVTVPVQLERIREILRTRNETFMAHGGYDIRHNATIYNWLAGQHLIERSQRWYAEHCAPSSGRKKRGVPLMVFAFWEFVIFFEALAVSLAELYFMFTQLTSC